MNSILAHAQRLVYTLLSLMPSRYQQQNLEAMLGLFLQAQGKPLPEHSQSKSASALSRFLNIYHWSTRSIIRTTRAHIIQEILSHCPKGRKPCLQVIIDRLIVNFCEVESGGVYKIFTTDCPLIEKTVSTYSLDKLLEELRVKQNCECN
jgi:hypothetical protein